MDKWLLVHRFKYLSREEKVAPVPCPDCGHAFVYMLGVDDEPVLWCPMDNYAAVPGQQFWQDMTAVVNEHFLE